VFSSGRRIVKALAITVVTVMFLIFAANNHGMMDVGLFPLPYTLSIPKFLFATICFALGVVIGSFYVNLKLGKTQRKYKSEHRRVMALQNEISSMRARDSQLSPQKLPHHLTTSGRG
jgi:uncharacterized integral membrane protein